MKKKKIEKKSELVRFSYKSAFLLLFGTLAATLGFPLLLDALGLDLKFLRVIVIGLTSGFLLSYCIYFVDSKRGAEKGFWIVAGLVSVLASLIAYFWVFNIYFL